MAVRTKSEIMELVKALVGEDTSDETLNSIADISDTLDDLEKKGNGDDTDWKKKYEENDAQWRQKYKDRFFSGEAPKEEKLEPKADDDETTNELKTDFEQLFKAKE